MSWQLATGRGCLGNFREEIILKDVFLASHRTTQLMKGLKIDNFKDVHNRKETTDT
jgi:hypothetical protein